MDTRKPAPLTDRTPHLRLAVSNPDPARQSLVIICREEADGGIALDLIGEDGLPRPVRLCPRRAAGFRASLKGTGCVTVT